MYKCLSAEGKQSWSDRRRRDGASVMSSHVFELHFWRRLKLFLFYSCSFLFTNMTHATWHFVLFMYHRHTPEGGIPDGSVNTGETIMLFIPINIYLIIFLVTRIHERA
ncbi:hypothetical protein BDP55DRAFT_124297 [Colletotrichum godetiae]|uniref:Uncharacterized protein n=1 Tax=Colletotrichum godetiae TaxID=1209918 RepID=A0AAJ0AXS6_9PEZI|nr:uncharacterized protein BDP55DRAFT_124297 [Colletotrichum godetiae]KAK1700269.1 hypothetical protein BDP55DRAFT_124297 [Colletotrichum godetiae]